MSEPAGGRGPWTQGLPGFVEQSRDMAHQTVRGWTSFQGVGRRLNIPVATTADVWGGTELTRPLPLAPLGMSVVSTSAADAFGTVLGAKTALVTFIDQDGDWRISDLLILTGTTPVAITYKLSTPLVTQGGLFGVPTPPDGSSIAASIYRVQSLAVITAAGQTEAAPIVTNQGTMTVVDTATATTIYDAALPGNGRSVTAALHVPRNFVAHVTAILGGTTRGQGTVFNVLSLPPQGAGIRVPLFAVDSQSIASPTDGAALAIGPQFDFKLIVTTASNNIDISAASTFRFEPIA